MSKVTEIIGDLKNIENTTGDVQASDADLTAIAALTGTSGLLKKTAVDTWTLDTTAYTTNLGTVTSVSGDSIISVATGITTPALTHSVADGYLHVPVKQKIYRSAWEYNTIVKIDNAMLVELSPMLNIDLYQFFLDASKL